jgi:hypothetical protein
MKPSLALPAIMTDAYGGHGGIAQYNHDFLGASAGGGTFSSITVLPRQASDTTAPPATIEQLPPRRGRAKPKGSRHNRTCRRRSGCYLLRRGLYLPHELTSLIGKEVTYEGLHRLNFAHAHKEQLRPDPRCDSIRVCVLESVALHTESAFARLRLGRDGPQP